jgi:hypothetical protein
MEWVRQVGRAGAYIAKYVSKGDSEAPFPSGARIYGVGGLEGDALNEARFLAMPKWLQEQVREQAEQGQQIRRCPHGSGWLNRESGEVFRSPWRVVFWCGTLWAYRIDDGGDGNVALDT